MYIYNSIDFSMSKSISIKHDYIFGKLLFNTRQHLKKIILRIGKKTYRFCCKNT